MEAMLGIKTRAQIAREYAVHPVQVSQWETVAGGPNTSSP